MFDKRRIRKHGLSAQALVLSVRDGSSFSGNSSRQKYHFVLEVRPDDRPPFQAQLSETFDIVERKPTEADLVAVKYEPDTLKTIFDLEGDPRFDLEAMQRRTSQLKWDTYHRTQAQPMPTPAPGAATADPIQALERLVSLRDSGAITDEEFATLKARLLNGPA
ncbi:SHOCT domain-containing protein [Dactylosporangium sp. CA-152071]|uniref:SHOCT domain-containing protein n=1 Tax=Dactylosporangium sp. CA-152071 TaxID=3239933 RepID=UPI003D8D6BE3